MAPSNKSNQQSLLIAGLATAAAVSMAYYVYSTSSEKAKTKAKAKPDDSDIKKTSKSLKLPSSSSSKSTTVTVPTSTTIPTSASSPTKTISAVQDKTPKTKNVKTEGEKSVHARIEELDKKGKVLFKNKEFLEAAETFTQALNLVEAHKASSGDDGDNASASLFRQIITLMNNRSAMYEKGSLPELSLEDCTAILDMEMTHTKARTRKLRVLETLNRHHDALVEVCAIQLLFMQQNRDNLRRGLPVPPPPVPQSKMEELLAEILPQEMKPHLDKLQDTKRPLPSTYTILQLLKSYTGYNQWMAQAAKDGSVDSITKQLKNTTSADNDSSAAQRASLLMKRGRRNMYDREYAAASQDFEQAYAMVKDHPEIQEALPADDHARLLEWVGMSRHFRYDLDSALSCYKQCADLEPTNALLLVKQAGVQMDAGKHEEALKLFDTALGMDPSAVDALLHRSNLRMLQNKPQEALTDLETCLKLRPNHVMARLRLASLLAATNDPDGAKKQLDQAETAEPNSSEIQSYRGELCFAEQDMENARKHFEKAIQLEPTNPTPYVNASMALLNTPPPPGETPDAPGVMKYLEKAIEVDPQFTAAYIQLGQLKLGTATDLQAARKVIDLYDQGLANCRVPEEVKELCSMRALAVAQVEAAQMLKMETFNLQ